MKALESKWAQPAGAMGHKQAWGSTEMEQVLGLKIWMEKHD